MSMEPTNDIEDPRRDTDVSLAVETGTVVMRMTDLGNRTAELVRLLPGLGRLALETSSTGAVSEVVTTYEGVKVIGSRATLEHRNVSVRVHLSSVAFARALRDAGHQRELGHRIDLVDSEGMVAHRVVLQHASRITDFDDLVASIRGCSGAGPPRPPTPSRPRRVARGTKPADPCSDVELREAWCSAVDGKDFVALVRELGISRGRMWRAVDNDWALPVSPASVALVATRAAMRSIPVAVTVGNATCTQTWRSTIAVACPASDELALLGCDCRALLRQEPSQSCWRVQTPKGGRLSLEVLDARGALVLELALGDPSSPEENGDYSDLRAAWTELFDGVPTAPTLEHVPRQGRHDVITQRVPSQWRHDLGTT
jgi:putative heme degradation protein